MKGKCTKLFNVLKDILICKNRCKSSKENKNLAFYLNILWISKYWGMMDWNTDKNKN